jgi:TonB family protein
VLAISLPCVPQTANKSEFEGSAAHIILSKLSQPTYPPLARQARVGGDVRIKLEIKADGSIESAKTVSGHPMLAQAALDSAKQSRFECRDCEVNSNASEILTYSFQISSRELDPCCCSSGFTSKNAVSVLHVSESGDHIMLTAPPACICPDRCSSARAFREAHFRSVKCLFLWKCGFHDYSIY